MAFPLSLRRSLGPVVVRGPVVRGPVVWNFGSWKEARREFLQEEIPLNESGVPESPADERGLDCVLTEANSAERDSGVDEPRRARSRAKEAGREPEPDRERLSALIDADSGFESHRRRAPARIQTRLLDPEVTEESQREEEFPRGWRG